MMTETREIITIQIGHYSNFVGAHWWNLQEASFCYDENDTDKLLINHDVLFREGTSPRGETTFTPRLISVDLKGSLGTLRQEGKLYNTPHQQSLPNWSGKIDILKTEAESRNEFLEHLDKQQQFLHPEHQLVFDEDKDICLDPGSTAQNVFSTLPRKKLFQLDDSVRLWSDYLRPSLHPRSVFLIDSFFHDDQEDTFELFGLGAQVYDQEKNREQIEEICRKTVEECAYLQGFQMLFDSFDGFSGFSSGYLQHLQDEYTNKPVFCYPLCTADYPSSPSLQSNRLLNLLFSLDAVSQRSWLFSLLNAGGDTIQGPQMQLPFQHLSYKTELSYHTSAILASWLDTSTLPLRTKRDHSTMRELADLMTPVGRKGLAASLCLPLAIREGSSLSEQLLKESLALTSLTPEVTQRDLSASPFKSKNSTNSVVQTLTMAGVHPSLYYPDFEPSSQKTSIEELLVKSLPSFWTSQINSVKVLGCPCHVSAPFPHLFKAEIDPRGFLADERPRNTQTTGVESVALASNFSNSDLIASGLLKKTLFAAERLKSNQLQAFHDTGCEKDDLQEIINNLKSFGENYVENLFKQ